MTKTTKLIKLGLGLLVLFFSPAIAQGLQAKLAISPPRLEIESDQIDKTQSLTILNLSLQEMRVNVTVQNWELDENNQYRALPPDEQSLDQWIVINPVRIVIPANSQQTVRIAIRPRANPVDGEHRAMVYFEEIIQTQNATGSQPNYNDAHPRHNFKIGVPVYAYFGQINRQAIVHRSSFNSVLNLLEFDISSTGNVHVRAKGDYIVIDAKNYRSDADLLRKIGVAPSMLNPDEILARGNLIMAPIPSGQRRQVNQAISINQLPVSAYYVGLKMRIADQVIEKVFKTEP